MRAEERSQKTSCFCVAHPRAFALLLVPFLLLACGSQRRTSPAQDLTQTVHDLRLSGTTAKVVVTTTCEGDTEVAEAGCNEWGRALTERGWSCTSIVGGVSCRLEA
jgi:hypothetical protein